MREKIILLGAGSAMFTRGLVTDLITGGSDIELALVDTDPAALEVAQKLAQKMVDARGSSVKISGSINRCEVLPGATVVICTIGVGGRRAWEQDVFIPRRHGIFMPVGDTVGPGGTARALRMIPAMVAIARDVRQLAPEALFFNYGNPMAATCRGVHKATGAKMIGLCHGVFHVGKYLAETLGVEPADFRYSAAGMNHLTWFTEMQTRDAAGRWNDARPALQRIAANKIEMATTSNLGAQFLEMEAGAAESGDDNPFSWHLFQLFEAFPAVLDRHVTEFFPQLFPCGQYYGKQLGMDAYSFEDTIAFGDRLYAEMSEIALSAAPLPADYFEQVNGEHEQVTEIIADIRLGRERIYSANLPNTGQIPNLPQGAVVETPCIAGIGGLRAIPQEALPTGVLGTLATRFQWVEATVEAALEGSREKFVQALLLDGAVPSLSVASQLADELLQAHAAYLPQFAK